MGLLALGTPLNWEEAKGHADYVRDHGIEQFLKIWHRLKNRTGDVLLWGDEVSFTSFLDLSSTIDILVMYLYDMILVVVTYQLKLTLIPYPRLSFFLFLFFFRLSTWLYLTMMKGRMLDYH